MTDVVQRMNYFDHQFLRVEDFIAEQSYHRNQRDIHGRYLHTPGVANGLEVDFNVGESRATVHQGVAIDSQGRTIVLPTDSDTIDLSSLTATTMYVWISYEEQFALHTSETGADGDRRVVELPHPQVTASPPGDPGTQILLARLTLDGAGTITAVDEGEAPNRRRYAGAVGGDLTAHTLALEDPNIGQADWPTLHLGAVKRADLEGTLHVNGNVELGAGATVDGRDVSADGQTLDAHSKATSNPHATTAAQIDTQGGANRIVTQINSGTGVIDDARVAATLARTSQLTAKQVGALASVDGVKNDGGDVDLQAGNTITVTPDQTNHRITIGETHSGTSGNPHSTTAAQIDNQGGANRIVTQINSGTGVIDDARVAATLARTSQLTAQQIDTTGGANRIVTQINSGTGVIDDARVASTLARTSQLTAQQIDTAGGTNRIVAQINSGNGVIADARIATTVARTSQLTAQQIDTASGANSIVGQINAGSGVINEARVDTAVARASQLTTKLNGMFFSGSVTIPSSGSIWVTATSQNLSGVTVAVRGWASAQAGNTPATITTWYGRWDALPANFREGWAIAKPSASFGGFFQFVEGSVTINVQLSLSSTGAAMSFQAPAGTNVGYIFQFTWQ